MNIYESRWNNAVKQAKKVNSLLNQGCIILNKEGENVNRFEIDFKTKEILEVASENLKYIWFAQNEEDWQGSDETIEEYNDRFKHWKVIDPKQFKKFLEI